MDVEVEHLGSVDLIMMPTHGYGPFRAALLGSVTAKVIHDTSRAVWTSAHVESLPNPPHSVRRILCAVDGADESVYDSIRIIRHAGLLAEDLSSSLVVIHAIRDGDAGQRSRLTSRLQSCEALAHVNVPIRVENGEIAKIVPQAVRCNNADLLIIGRGHAEDALGLWRSHVYSMIRNSPCPVLTI